MPRRQEPTNVGETETTLPDTKEEIEAALAQHLMAQNADRRDMEVLRSLMRGRQKIIDALSAKLEDIIDGINE